MKDFGITKGQPSEGCPKYFFWRLLKSEAVMHDTGVVHGLHLQIWDSDSDLVSCSVVVPAGRWHVHHHGSTAGLYISLAFFWVGRSQALACHAPSGTLH